MYKGLIKNTTVNAQYNILEDDVRKKSWAFNYFDHPPPAPAQSTVRP